MAGRCSFSEDTAALQLEVPVGAACRGCVEGLCYTMHTPHNTGSGGGRVQGREVRESL
jgi:hypothetical protein